MGRGECPEVIGRAKVIGIWAVLGQSRAGGTDKFQTSKAMESRETGITGKQGSRQWRLEAFAQTPTHPVNHSKHSLPRAPIAFLPAILRFLSEVAR